MRICISVNRNLLPYKGEYVTNQFINGGENGLSAEKQRLIQGGSYVTGPTGWIGNYHFY